MFAFLGAGGYRGAGAGGFGGAGSAGFGGAGAGGFGQKSFGGGAASRQYLTPNAGPRGSGSGNFNSQTGYKY